MTVIYCLILELCLYLAEHILAILDPRGNYYVLDSEIKCFLYYVHILLDMNVTWVMCK